MKPPSCPLPWAQKSAANCSDPPGHGYEHGDVDRLASIFAAFAEIGIHAEPAIYHDDFCEEVRRQLLEMDAVPVWMNPIQDGRDRTLLDSILRDCDFLFGSRTPSGDEPWVLCEINVSSIAPYPESAAPLVARAVQLRLQAEGKRGR